MTKRDAYRFIDKCIEFFDALCAWEVEKSGTEMKTAVAVYAKAHPDYYEAWLLGGRITRSEARKAYHKQRSFGGDSRLLRAWLCLFAPNRVNRGNAKCHRSYRY